jgi:hypothetical protein
MLDGLEEWNPRRFTQPGTLGIFGEVALERVVARHFMELAAFSWSRTQSRRCWWKMIGHVQAAETRAKVNTITPIRARSRNLK